MLRRRQARGRCRVSAPEETANDARVAVRSVGPAFGSAPGIARGTGRPRWVHERFRSPADALSKPKGCSNAKLNPGIIDARMRYTGCAKKEAKRRRAKFGNRTIKRTIKGNDDDCLHRWMGAYAVRQTRDRDRRESDREGRG